MNLNSDYREHLAPLLLDRSDKRILQLTQQSTIILVVTRKEICHEKIFNYISTRCDFHILMSISRKIIKLHHNLKFQKNWKFGKETWGRYYYYWKKRDTSSIIIMCLAG